MWFANGGPFSVWLAIFWGGILMACLIVSLAAPINKAMPYFKIASGIFSVINTIAYLGIFTQLMRAGPTPAMLIKNPGTDDWEPVYVINNAVGTKPIHHISVLFFVGLIMFGVMFAPLLMRPKDFLFNFQKYICGLVVWFVMLPCYVNIFQIYAMSNLHDITWGNRPAAADTAQMSANLKKQAKLLDNYKMFRINTLVFWILCNIIYVIAIQDLKLSLQPDNVANDG